MIKPWYKQFWPWFLIALPLTVVIWTTITVIIFANHSVSLVTEDYYKKGKGINIDLSRINVAKDLGLGASVLSTQDEIILEFDKGTLPHYPALNISFAHRTLPDHDFDVMVTADANGRYKIQTEQAIQGPWFVQITPHDKQWLIQGRVTFPSDSLTALN